MLHDIVFSLWTVMTLIASPNDFTLIYFFGGQGHDKIINIYQIDKTKDLFWILMFPHHVIIIWFSVWTNKFTNTALKARWNKVFAFYVHPHICFVFWAVTTLDTTPWTAFSLGKILINLKIKFCNNSCLFNKQSTTIKILLCALHKHDFLNSFYLDKLWHNNCKGIAGILSA